MTWQELEMLSHLKIFFCETLWIAKVSYNLQVEGPYDGIRWTSIDALVQKSALQCHDAQWQLYWNLLVNHSERVERGMAKPSFICERVPKMTLSWQNDPDCATTGCPKIKLALGKHLDLGFYGYQMDIFNPPKKNYWVQILQDLYYVTQECILPVEILFPIFNP